ncbi:hypothetical protein IRJ41_018602 [Triplophysa rosa]|uniref:Uncharacterized protein n=1 Tax=Triplophysa rosa TaxID=992332 RepID=A0A9W8CBK0_TRIRA|nr:hypothetical protein IRJ41_018602 [Triplophysa rosa]
MGVEVVTLNVVKCRKVSVIKTAVPLPVFLSSQHRPARAFVLVEALGEVYGHPVKGPIGVEQNVIPQSLKYVLEGRNCTSWRSHMASLNDFGRLSFFQSCTTKGSDLQSGLCHPHVTWKVRVLPLIWITFKGGQPLASTGDP